MKRKAKERRERKKTKEGIGERLSESRRVARQYASYLKIGDGDSVLMLGPNEGYLMNATREEAHHLSPGLVAACPEDTNHSSLRIAGVGGGGRKQGQVHE